MPGPTLSSVRPARPDPARWRTAIGRRLREAREDAALRLVDVAGAAGVSPQYLSEVERGRKEASSEVLQAVTGALGMTLVDLAGGVARDLARSAAPDRPVPVLPLSAMPGPAAHRVPSADGVPGRGRAVRGSARDAVVGRGVTLLAA
jgi:transcriptional regulator with XRE-family HTH domain